MGATKSKAVINQPIGSDDDKHVNEMVLVNTVPVVNKIDLNWKLRDYKLLVSAYIHQMIEDDLKLEIPPEVSQIILDILQKIDDPYYEFESKICDDVKIIKSNLVKWNTMLEDINQNKLKYTDRNFVDLTNLMKSQYKKINRSLKMIKKTIDSVKRNPTNFPFITETTLNRRKEFVKHIRSIIDDIRGTMTTDRAYRRTNLIPNFIQLPAANIQRNDGSLIDALKHLGVNPKTMTVGIK